MRPLLAVLALMCPAMLMADNIRPDASGLPIFQVFPLIENTSKVVSLDRDHPLLSVENSAGLPLRPVRTDKGDAR